MGSLSLGGWVGVIFVEFSGPSVLFSTGGCSG